MIRTALLLFVLCQAAPGTLAATVVRISDLRNSPLPPNPIIVSGRVHSAQPLRLTDGKGAVTVNGVTARTGDFVVVEGDYAGGILTPSTDRSKQHIYVLPGAVEVVYVAPGPFLMGNNGNESYTPANELPQHEVYLSGYWIGRYEVTRGQYRRFMEAGGYSNPTYWSYGGWVWKERVSRTEPERWDYVHHNQDGSTFAPTDDHPVERVTYYEAEAFCNWAGGKLPTEAQWEKAARWDGFYPLVYPWGNVFDASKASCSRDSLSNDCHSVPLGSFPQDVSPYGCFDMAGNVTEWARDRYCDCYYSESPYMDPPGHATSLNRVVRGGNVLDGDYHCRTAVRTCVSSPETARFAWGFRIAR